MLLFRSNGIVVAACLVGLNFGVGAETQASPEQRGLMPSLLGLRATSIAQVQRHITSPYEGPNSLPGLGDRATSTTLNGSFGAKLTQRFHLYGEVRHQSGGAIANGSGLAGFTNGDYIPGTSARGAYLSRTSARYIVSTGDGQSDNVDASYGDLGGELPQARLEIKFGRIAPNDDFDKNRFMLSPQQQFMNLGLINNAAWDYAQNDRGFSNGLVVQWIQPKFTVSFGSYQMPTAAAGKQLQGGFHSRNDNIEVVFTPAQDDGPTFRVLAYQNRAVLGDYRQALLLAGAASVPDLVSTRRQGRRKAGFGATLELPIGKDPNTGAFACAGWNDGKTEDFSYTESDRDICAGIQLGGSHWGRPRDRFAAAVLFDGISGVHRDYLRAGGIGLQLGDGNLRYGIESITEIYYAAAVGKYLTITPDLQLIKNPGYNRDRGPAAFFTVRATAAF